MTRLQKTTALVRVTSRYDSDAGHYSETREGRLYYHARMYYIRSRQAGTLRIVNLISYADGRRAVRVAGRRGSRGEFFIPCADDGFGNLIAARQP